MALKKVSGRSTGTSTNTVRTTPDARSRSAKNGHPLTTSVRNVGAANEETTRTDSELVMRVAPSHGEALGSPLSFANGTAGSQFDGPHPLSISEEGS